MGDALSVPFIVSWLDIIYIMYNNNIICNKNNNNNLLRCKRQALLLAKSENPPVKDNGRRKGYMELTKELWDQMGHEDLGFTKQSLRDQAARIEKSLGSVTRTITNGIKAKRGGDNAEGKKNRICIQP